MGIGTFQNVALHQVGAMLHSRIMFLWCTCHHNCPLPTSWLKWLIIANHCHCCTSQVVWNCCFVSWGAYHLYASPLQHPTFESASMLRSNQNEVVASPSAESQHKTLPTTYCATALLSPGNHAQHDAQHQFLYSTGSTLYSTVRLETMTRILFWHAWYMPQQKYPWLVDF